MTAFSNEKRLQQELWRAGFVPSQEHGRQNGRTYLHVLPRHEWEYGLFPGLRKGQADALEPYLEEKAIKAHTGVHNLCSSWVLCANLYFPFRDVAGRELLAGFLSEELQLPILACHAVELEYERSETRFKPASLLGEESGGRGTGQTSPDLAFEVTTPQGPGIVLVESKFTEHWFYECSGHKRSVKGRTPNPDRRRCQSLETVLSAPADQCHVTQSWNRRYWEHLQLVIDRDAVKLFGGCPAARGAYQLLRQQALAEALANSGEFALVVSAVAYDEENKGLFLMRTISGEIVDLRREWPNLVKGKAPFKTFTHQSWVTYVRKNAASARSEWLTYVRDRYGFPKTQ